MNQCTYCKKTLASKRNLLRHIRETQYCLALRNKVNTDWQCECCKRYCSSKQSLQNHEPRCRLIAQGIHLKKVAKAKAAADAEVARLKKENSNLKKENAKLEDDLEIAQDKVETSEKKIRDLEEDIKKKDAAFQNMAKIAANATKPVKKSK